MSGRVVALSTAACYQTCHSKWACMTHLVCQCVQAVMHDDRSMEAASLDPGGTWGTSMHTRPQGDADMAELPGPGTSMPAEFPADSSTGSGSTSCDCCIASPVHTLNERSLSTQQWDMQCQIF